MAESSRNLIASQRRLASLNAGLSLLMLLVVLRQEYFDLWSDAFGLSATYGLGLGVTAVSVLHQLVRARRALDGRTYLRGTWVDLALVLPVLLSIPSPMVFSVAVLVRQSVVLSRALVETTVGRRLVAELYLKPTRLLVMSFIVVIAAGTLLLTFPRATTDHEGADLVDAVFTSTSATCVTGLIVMNTRHDDRAAPELRSFSSFGELVILVLIQIGGLGIMTLSGAVVVLLGRRLTMRSRGLLQNLVDEDSGHGMVQTIRSIVIMTFAVEGVGALLLFLLLGEEVPDAGPRAWVAVFHSVSAFCNAGFSLWSDSLMRLRDSVAVNAVISVLIILGGLGFSVVGATISLGGRFGVGAKRTARRFPVHAHLVLVTTFGLLLAGTIAWYFLEFGRSLDGMSVPEKLLASFFQSVTLRTAGFNTVDFAEIGRVTVIVSVVFMIIGGSPGGTAGGIKTSTLAVLVLSVRSMVRGHDEVEIRGRTIPRAIIYKSVAIVVIAFSTFLVVLALLLLTQPELPFEALVFETASALGTVGLSMGITAKLTTVGKLLIVLLMFVGRLGPLTLAVAVGEGAERRRVRYPEARIAVG